MDLPKSCTFWPLAVPFTSSPVTLQKPGTWKAFCKCLLNKCSHCPLLFPLMFLRLSGYITLFPGSVFEQVLSSLDDLRIHIFQFHIFKLGLCVYIWRGEIKEMSAKQLEDGKWFRKWPWDIKEVLDDRKPTTLEPVISRFSGSQREGIGWCRESVIHSTCRKQGRREGLWRPC